MRRVSIKTGLKQRLNEILGESITDDAIGNLTAWSIQAAMLSNLERIVKGLTGTDGGRGRKMKGLTLNSPSTTEVTISTGVGFTSSGKVIDVQSALTKEIDTGTDGEKHLYLKHILEAVVEIDNDAGKNTNFIDGSAQEQIVADDLAAGLELNVNTRVDDLIRVANTDLEVYTPPAMEADEVYLGYVTVQGGSVVDTNESSNDGFS